MCNDSENPQLFYKYFTYFDSIRAHEKPDYDWLTRLFANELTVKEKENLDIPRTEIDHTNTSKNSNFDQVERETSFKIPNELIGDRFKAGDSLGDGYTGFVLSGKENKYISET